VDFLRRLLRQIPGDILVIWDGLRQHRSRMVQDFVAAQNGRLALESLPAYAPELNPVEYIWGYWKRYELPNFCPRDYGQLSQHAPAEHAAPIDLGQIILETGSVVLIVTMLRKIQ